MGRELKSLQTETSIRVNTVGVNPMAMESTTGQMEVILKVVLEMAYERVMVCGRRDQAPVTNMKVSIYQIRNTDMVYFLGHQAIFTKGIMKMI